MLGVQPGQQVDGVAAIAVTGGEGIGNNKDRLVELGEVLLELGELVRREL